MTCLFMRRAADPYAAEVRNLLIGSALVAALVPLIYFSLLPSVVLLTLTMMDKIATGIRGLWIRAPQVMLAAGVASTAIMGLHWALKASMCVMVACLPVVSLHTLSVSVVSYRLVRQSTRQNQMLDELHRVDTLTDLFGRSHWQERAEATLHRHHTTDEPTCMLMLDIDHSKKINGTCGRTAGDEVIHMLAHVVWGNIRTGDCAGRYGKDEFAIVLPGMHARDALAIAQRIHEQAEGVRLRSLPELRITSNISVAPVDHRHSSLRAWVDAADVALYAAKNGRCNRVAECMEPALVPAVQQPILRPTSGLVGGCRVRQPLHPHRATSARRRRRASLYTVALRNDAAQCEPRAHPLELHPAVQALEHTGQGVPSFPVQ